MEGELVLNSQQYVSSLRSIEKNTGRLAHQSMYGNSHEVRTRVFEPQSPIQKPTYFSVICDFHGSAAMRATRRVKYLRSLHQI